MTRPLVPLLTWLFAAALTSCSVQATLEVSLDRSAKFSGTISLDPNVQRYWNDLKQLDPKLPSKPLEAGLFQKSLDRNVQSPNSNYTAGKAVAKGENALDVSLSIADVNRIPSSLAQTESASSTLVSIKTAQGQSTLTLTLDRRSFKTLVDLTAYGKSQALSSLIPEESNAVKPAEYRDLLTFLLEPYTNAPGPIVDASEVEVKLVLPRKILASTGTRSVQGNVATCRWSLVEVLVLARPIVVSVTY